MDNKFKGPFGGTDEQGVNDYLEKLVGIDRAFQLMNLSRDCQQRTSGNKFSISLNQISAKDLFVKTAKNNRYKQEAIDFYLKYFW